MLRGTSLIQIVLITHFSYLLLVVVLHLLRVLHVETFVSSVLLQLDLVSLSVLRKLVLELAKKVLLHFGLRL